MRTLFVQTLRELRSIFYTPVAYVVMTMFLMMVGYNFYSAAVLLNGSGQNETVLETTFLSALFIFVFAITTTLITMRSFAEEYRLGTIEMLTTAPISDWQVVLSKFIAALLFYVVLFAPTALYFWIFQHFAAPAVAAKSVGAILSTYLILMLIGTLFISVGLLASSLVRDQVNAAVISLCANISFIFVPAMVTKVIDISDPRFRAIAEFVAPIAHLADFCLGIVDTRRIVWYLSASAFFIMLTHHIFQSRKLRH
jgi:ABC-2 type transport system permease protein